jgi:hypothetical protein
VAVFDYPSSLTPKTVSWGLRKSVAQFRSPMAGSVQSVEFPGSYWFISITLPEWSMRSGGGGEAEAFFARLAGGVDRVRVPYWPRPIPLGSMRDTPTVNTSIGRGSQAVFIATNGGLKAGDMFEIGGQLFQTFIDCTPVSGVLTVPLVNRVRFNITAGSAVNWNRPTVTCLVPSQSSSTTYQQGMMAGLAIDLEEAP